MMYSTNFSLWQDIFYVHSYLVKPTILRRGCSEILWLCRMHLLLDLWTYDLFQWLTSQVTPQLSCPVALFSYYNPILKRGTDKFMSTIRDSGVHGETQLK